VAGNFALNNQQTTGGNSDGEGLMVDTLDALAYSQTLVIRDNIVVLSERFGLHLFYQQESTTNPTLKIYNNTLFANNRGNYTNGLRGNFGEINIQSTVPTLPWHVYLYNNISNTGSATQVHGGNIYALLVGGDYAGTVIGNTGANPASQNIFKSQQSSCASTCDRGNNVVSFGSSRPLGVNTYVDPAFNNTIDLLANRMGTPNCSGFENVTQCMGYDASTEALTNPSVIYDLTATAEGTTEKGYRRPSSTCVATASDPDFPVWLKGIVFLHWTGSIVQRRFGLVNVPCRL
jgi:hypothetical protein